jgi:hypothetical protein
MWKIATIVLVIIFLIADSIYLYLRLKKYWRHAPWQRTAQKNKQWKLGLSSLDIFLNKQAGKDPRPPSNR